MIDLQSAGLFGLFIGTFLAATVVPFSSDALYLGILAATQQPLACLIVGTMGNWLGGVTTYYIGRLAKWEWIEKHFRVKEETVLRQKAKIDKYGIWLALLSWVPFIGDIIGLALGFYKTPPVPTLLLLLLGKFIRFVVWTVIFIGITY